MDFNQGELNTESEVVLCDSVLYQDQLASVSMINIDDGRIRSKFINQSPLVKLSHILDD